MKQGNTDEIKVWQGKCESGSKRNVEKLLVLPKPAENLPNGADFSRKKHDQTGSAESQKMASAPQNKQLTRILETALPKR